MSGRETGLAVALSLTAVSVAGVAVAAGLASREPGRRASPAAAVAVLGASLTLFLYAVLAWAWWLGGGR